MKTTIKPLRQSSKYGKDFQRVAGWCDATVGRIEWTVEGEGETLVAFDVILRKGNNEVADRL